MKNSRLVYLTLVFVSAFLVWGRDKIKADEKYKQKITEQNLKDKIQESLKNNAVVIDVRTPEEYSMGHYKKSLNIPYNQIEQRIKDLEKYKNKTIILYCRSGRRAEIAKKMLESNGFKNVINGINQSYFPKE